MYTCGFQLVTQYMKSKMAELSDESGAEGEKEDTTKVKKKQKADKLQVIQCAMYSGISSISVNCMTHSYNLFSNIL